MSVTSKKDSRIIVRTCRICLDAKSVDMVLIEEQNGWLKRFEFCFGFTLTTQDEPRFLCPTCADKIQSYVKFKEKCHNSHNLWKMVISDVKCNIVKNEGFENLTTTKENHNDPVINTTHIKNENFVSIFDEGYDDSIFSNNDEFQISIAEIKTVIDDDTKSEDEENSIKKNDFVVRNTVESNQTKSKTAITNGRVKSERKKGYTCTKCKCSYGKKKWYLKHKKTCRGRKKEKRKIIMNPECFYSLGRRYVDQNIDNDVKQELQNEIEIIGNESNSLLSCGLCNLSFSNIKDVFTHLQDHWSNNDLACKLCDFFGVDVAAIISHRFAHLSRKIKIFECHICEKPKKMNSLLKLHFHYRKEHLNKAGGFCSRCNREYNNQRLWRKHERMHAAPMFICDFCGKKFNRKSSLVDHVIHHMELDKCICDICGKVIYRRRYLKLHKETVHYNAEPFKCNHCNRMFKTQFSLNKHLKNVTREKTVECEVCHKSFITPNVLKEHMIIHSDEKPYSCDLCGNRYKRKAHLTVHLQKHTGLIPQCEICMKTFTSKRSLERHAAAVHMGVRRYSCTVASCERNFNTKKQMLDHLQRRHKSDILVKSQVMQEKIV